MFRSPVLSPSASPSTWASDDVPLMGFSAPLAAFPAHQFVPRGQSAVPLCAIVLGTIPGLVAPHEVDSTASLAVNEACGADESGALSLRGNSK